MKTSAMFPSFILATLLVAGSASASTQSDAQGILDSFGRSITYGVTVEIDNRIAIISGSVDSYDDAVKIITRIKQLEGVDRVYDRLRHPGIHQ